MHPILKKLQGGDRRSIGRADEVAAEVLAEPGLFDTLFSGMLSADPLVRMRAADAVEKITARHPELLEPHKTILIEEISRLEQQEVRWHAALMLPRVKWGTAGRKRVLAVLTGYLDDKSSIVKTCAMQAMADLARDFPALRPRVAALLRELCTSGTPAMKARGRRLVAELELQPAGRGRPRRHASPRGA